MKHQWRIVSALLLVFTAAIAATGCARGTPQVAPTSTPDMDVESSATPSPTAASLATPINATVALSPSSGPPGTEINVATAGFPPNSEIELGIGRDSSEYDVVTSARTDAEGFLSTTLAIPNAAEPEEDWVVVAMTEDGEVRAVSTPFQVTASQYEPQVAISPSSGPPGSEVQLVAQGFPPAAVVEVGVGREDSEYDVVGTTQTGNDGSLVTEVTIPAFAELEERWVVVVTTEDRSVEAVSNAFEVVEGEYQPTVTISPTSGPAGTRVQVVAEGFPPEAAVDIGIGRVGSEYDVVSTAQTDADGHVDTEITIPDFVEPEDRWVIVVATEHPPAKAISEEFDVTQEATPTPSGALFTRTNIYLIAVGDEGETGMEIGCGDSVIPVEVEIEATVAPMTAAFNKLLGIETREYGRSGLYNALHQSELEVESIDIDNQEAIIKLSGTLLVGGACDIPRIRAQLQQTALQYDTVDQVSIFVNGTPLEDLLSAEGE